MRNIPTKHTDDELPAIEWNDVPDELENIITSTNITLSAADLFQIAKTVANYVAAGDFYLDVGSANNYVLNTIGLRKGPTEYFDGMRVRFKIANTNTGASTANPNSLGVKDIKKEDGISDLGPGDLPAGQHAEIIYNNVSGNFELYSHKYEDQNFTTGDGKITIKIVADAGWVIMNDGTIGDATSGATTRANADCEQLFILIWNNIPNTWAPLQNSSGTPISRGASAAADWAAHNRLSLTRQLGRGLAVSGAGSGLTTRVLGEYLGEEAHVLSKAEIPTHVHTYTKAGDFLFQSGAATPCLTSLSTVNTGNGSADGLSGNAHNNMQPTAFWNVMMKL